MQPHTEDNILDHRRGKRDSGEQAKLVLRWDTRAWWDEICQRLGCNEAVARVVIALWAEHISAGRWTSYSRNKDHYRRFHSQFYTKHLVVSAAEWLDKAGLIHHWVQEENVRDWQSCMKAKPSLILIMQDIVRKLGRPVPAMPREQLILRNARGESVGIRETRATKAMRRQVDEVNEMLLAADTSCSLAAVNRIFNGRMDRGGRWYAIGGAWQQMSEVARGEILIDGQRTVELDYKTQHAAMLFSDAGQTIPPDAYDIPGYDRELVKVGFLVLVNAKTELEAIGAIAGKDEIDSLAEPDTKDAMKAARSLMKAIKCRHQSILSAFHSDAGAGLMRRDSEIAGHVLTTMTRKGITVLPVHDSFIVRETAKEVLEEVMREATTLAGLPDIRIERKVPKEKIRTPRRCKPDSTISGRCKTVLPTYPPSCPSLPPPLLSASADSISNVVLGLSGSDSPRGATQATLAPARVVSNELGDISRGVGLRFLRSPSLDAARDLDGSGHVSTPVKARPSFWSWLNDPSIKLSDVYPDADMPSAAAGAPRVSEVGLQSSSSENVLHEDVSALCIRDADHYLNLTTASDGPGSHVTVEVSQQSSRTENSLWMDVDAVSFYGGDLDHDEVMLLDGDRDYDYVSLSDQSSEPHTVPVVAPRLHVSPKEFNAAWRAVTDPLKPAKPRKTDKPKKPKPKYPRGPMPPVPGGTISEFGTNRMPDGSLIPRDWSEIPF